ncbi:unnamed protein product [Discosporangium mesarthrocarpum]
MYEVFIAASKLPLEEYLRSEDPRFHHIFNNFMVRAMSGDMRVPDNDDDWEQLLDQAKDNLKQLDHIASLDTLEQDMQTILAQCNVPYIAPLRRQNETKHLIEKRRDRSDETQVFNEAVEEQVRWLTRYDCKLFEFAEGLRNHGRTTGA